MTFQDTYKYIQDEINQCLDSTSSAQIELFINQLLHSKRIFCFGAGRSGIILKTFCMRLNHLGCEAYYIGDLPCPAASNDDMLLTISGSGETGSVLALANQAKALDSTIACITSDHTSTLSRIADCIIAVHAPCSLINGESSTEKQPMRTLFEQTAFLICESISLMLKSRMKVSEASMASRHANLE